MKTEQLYGSLKELAERLGVTVTEQSFKNVGLKVKSGLCTVKGEQLFIMDKHKSLRTKVDLLADCLAAFPLENVYIVPAVREVIDKHRPRQKKKNPVPDPDQTGVVPDSIPEKGRFEVQGEPED